MSRSLSQLYFYSPEGLQARRTGAQVTTLLRAAGQVMAQRDDGLGAFYVSDLQGSVISWVGRGVSCATSYSAYGRDAGSVIDSLARFNGQRKEAMSGHYILGEGYRAFSPDLMRFLSPDSLSPFGAGWLNAYGYCGGDPVNRTDPSGHFWEKLFGTLFRVRRRGSSPNVELTNFSRSSVPETLMTQSQANQILSSRLEQHNQSVWPKSFAEGLAYLGRDTAPRFETISKSSAWSFNDHVHAEAVAASLTRDYQKYSRHPGFDEFFGRVVSLEAKIKASIPPEGKLDRSAKWQLSEEGTHIRVT